MLLFIYSIVFFYHQKVKKGLKNGEMTRYHGNIILQYTYEYLTVDMSHVYLFAENTFLN